MLNNPVEKKKEDSQSLEIQIMENDFGKID